MELNICMDVHTCMERNEAGRAAGAGTVEQSQGSKDAAADARTLIVNARPRFGSALWAAQTDGSRAVVAILDGSVYLAGVFAVSAAHAARKAVPGLRG